MAAAGQDTRGRTSSEFVDDTILEAFVPAASQVNVQELLEAWDGEVLEDKNTIVPFIEQRPFLLLGDCISPKNDSTTLMRSADEEVPVHIVLRTKLLDEDTLEAYLARLAISLEARAYGTLYNRQDDDHHANKKPATANELLYSGTIDPDEEPTICATEVQTEGHDEPIQYVYIFWKVTVPISRPKAKINKLSIYFTPSAALKPIEAAPKAQEIVDDEYLTPGVAQPQNLLAAFANDPALRGVKPKLLASNLYRAPTTPAVKSLQRNLRSGSRRLFRAAPAFLWRLRFIPSPSPAERGSTIAALDLEITPFASSPVRLEDVHLDLVAGRVEVLTPLLPKECQPGDQVTLLYKLWPGKKEEIAALGSTLPDLKVTASGSVLISLTCIPRIKFSWTTPVDLPTPSRPTSRAGPPAVIHSPRKEQQPAKPVGPDTLLSMASPPPQIASPAAKTSRSTLTNGLIISITGPESITVGHNFTWSLFIVNRSEKVHRLALVAIPKRRPWSKHGQKDSVASIRGGYGGDGKGTRGRQDLADAIVDERAVFAAQRNAVQDPTGLICLSPDVRVG